MRTSQAVPPPRARAPKRERSSVETKRRILEAAQAEFAAKGFDGARLAAIARAAVVQQALIHHYFADKEGLHAEVVRGGLAAMTEGAWDLVSRMETAPSTAVPKKTARKAPGKKTSPGGLDRAELTSLAEAFVDLLLRFFADNGAFLAVLRHEARRDASAVTRLVAEVVSPIFQTIVARLEELQRRGEIRRDVSAPHLVLSCVAMVAFPFQEEPLVAAVWPSPVRSATFRDERRRHVVEMVLARLLP